MTKATILPSGRVHWEPPAIYKSSCTMEVAFFPFDEQICTMKFGSWTYDGTKLDIAFHEDGPVNTEDYVPSKEWDLANFTAKKNVVVYPGLENTYVDLTFTLTIKRVAMFYNYILILPCVLLSFLTLVIFWLPPESPAKVMLGKQHTTWQ